MLTMIPFDDIKIFKKDVTFLFVLKSLHLPNLVK